MSDNNAPVTEQMYQELLAYSEQMTKERNELAKANARLQSQVDELKGHLQDASPRGDTAQLQQWRNWAKGRVDMMGGIDEALRNMIDSSLPSGGC